MCYDADAIPPVEGSAATPVNTGLVTLVSADGTRFAGFCARPEPSSPDPGVGVVILPDLRGLAGFYQRLAVRFAEQGHMALAIDYFGRTAGARHRGDGFPFMEHAVRLTRAGMQADLVAAADYLRGPDGGACRVVVAVGFCVGGRLAFFASAPQFGLAGVIGFYGAPGIAGPYGPGPTQHAAELASPVLGLFGGADEGIPPGEVAAFDHALSAAGVAHQIVTYPGAPHGFFDVRQDEHAEASADAWRRVLAFVGERASVG
ncbi:MAG TPA: dienelactone hydrolase family protein [Actinomycetes bacterium]|nr:dienelactone hydrolase family protein [Actinomycetes bacterium]